MTQEIVKPLLRDSGKKIVFLILDGLGGLPIEPGGHTELEEAFTPNMDQLASEGTLGQTIPILPGVTPGSGPAHLALFGYDPLIYNIGRGVLSAAGVNLRVNPGDVAARGNFCTIDKEGVIADRRAGRISSEESAPLVERLDAIKIPNVEIVVQQVKEYRFTVVMRGEGLDANLTDTDPQMTGALPRPVLAISPAADQTASMINTWLKKVKVALSDQTKANFVTLRGFATDPGLTPLQEAYNLHAACIAVYPMYRGVSRLLGMDVIEFKGEDPIDEINILKTIWRDYDFFFIHIKKTDSKGEDGDFYGKVKVIETVDRIIPNLVKLSPDVLIITGDHSTPALLKSHSWHPVPLLLWAPDTHLPDTQNTFGERACALGGLGTFPALNLMSIALAHAGRINKYGA